MSDEQEDTGTLEVTVMNSLREYNGDPLKDSAFERDLLRVFESHGKTAPDMIVACCGPEIALAMHRMIRRMGGG